MIKDTTVSSSPPPLDIAAAEHWLLLIHQLPPKPDYLRVKIWRRMQGLGAMAIKNSVYALPCNDQTREDFQWLLKEIEGAGGEASVCEARFIDGLSDAQVRALFNAAREADYSALSDEIREALAMISATSGNAGELRTRFSRMQRRCDQISAIDFFGAASRAGAAALLGEFDKLLNEQEAPVASPAEGKLSGYVGRTWATRPGIRVDRMASAWLIQRFIDPAARFVFTDVFADEQAPPRARTIRFDMSVGEFTHEGDHCTFEVLRERFQIDDPAVVAIARVIHDLDLKDDKFQPDEAAGIGAVLSGIALSGKDDEQRMRLSAVVFDALYRQYDYLVVRCTLDGT
ncbi:MAG: chromate resistance protein [Hydrocarboniphaga sp.]|nr:chromate resistance protein [Hydrocarboniphaga sp.]